MEILIFAAITTAMVFTGYYTGKNVAKLEIMVAINRLVSEITGENIEELKHEKENLKRETEDNTKSSETLIKVLEAGERSLESLRIHEKILKEFSEIGRRWQNGK